MPTATVSRPHRSPETPPPAEAPDDSFKVLNTYALVVPARSHGGLQADPIFGEVAWLPGRGRVARWATRFPSGVIDWTIRTDPADPDTPQEVLHGATDATAVVARATEQARIDPRKRMATVAPTPLEIERDRFSAQWPLISEALGLSRIRPDRRFEPGPCHFPTQHNPDWGADIDWASFRDRHCAGDFGEHGTFDPIPLTEEEAWALGLQPALVRNRHAIATGMGVVKSLYPLPVVRAGSAFAVNVLTAMAPGRGPVTVMLPAPAATPL